jgi:uncharacterized paraquat-inducible protein A
MAMNLPEDKKSTTTCSKCGMKVMSRFLNTNRKKLCPVCLDKNRRKSKPTSKERVQGREVRKLREEDLRLLSLTGKES